MSAAGVPSRLTWRDGERLPAPMHAALIGPGAPFEMGTEQVRGRAHTVFVRRPASLRDVLVSGAERFGDRPCLVFPERTATFADVLADARSAARVLRERFGVGHGDRVAIASPNSYEYAVTTWASISLGAITVALNGWWTGPELAYGVELTSPTVVFGDAVRLERLAAAVGARTGPQRVLFDGQWWGETHAGDALPTVEIAEDDPYLVLFTSGTTGRPKGALLSHRGNIHFMQAAMLGGAAAALLHGPPPSGEPPCILSASPMFHIAGMNSQLIMAPMTGSTIVYAPPGRWDEHVHLGLTEQYRVTNWSLVPTQLWRLLDLRDLGRYDLSSVRGIGGGSTVWPPELLRRVAEQLPTASVRLGYGMTETNGHGTTLGAPFIDRFPESVGEASPALEVEVRDPASGRVLDVGEVGEVCVRTPAVLLGYWGNAEATTAALDEDHWYRTGDFGRVENGVLVLEGRRHDLIIRGGENIYPAEIENRLVEHPAISDAAVIGLDHRLLGQEVKAFVVVSPGARITATDVTDWVAATLAGYKVPSVVEFVDELPRNAMGKVMKQLLASPETPTGFVQE